MKKLHDSLTSKFTWYRMWHQMPNHNVLHVLILTIFIIGSGSVTLQAFSATLDKTTGVTLNLTSTDTRSPLQLCTATTTPFITMTYPNGGEAFNADQLVTVTWTSCNIPAGDQVSISLYAQGQSMSQPLYSLSGANTFPNSGSAVVMMRDPMSFSQWSATSTYGLFYKILIRDVQSTTNPLAYNKWDLSDTLFSINSNCGLGDTWTQKTDLGSSNDGRNSAIAFSIGNKGYVGGGMDSTVTKNDFWEYDPQTNVWTQKANIGGSVRSDAFAFSIGNKGYVGGGTDGAFVLNDFYEYNPVANTWTQKANVSVNKFEATGFSIDTNGDGITDKGYVGAGLDQNFVAQNDFYEYNPVTNAWTQKANFGGVARIGAVGFGIGKKGYMGTGSFTGAGGTIFQTTTFADFWEYNPLSNTWVRKTDFPGGTRGNAIGFSIGQYGYIGTGISVVSNTDFYPNTFYQYNPLNNTWTQKANFTGSPLYGAVGFSVGVNGYVATGFNGTYTKRLYQYCQAAPDIKVLSLTWTTSSTATSCTTGVFGQSPVTQSTTNPYINFKMTIKNIGNAPAVSTIGMDNTVSNSTQLYGGVQTPISLAPGATKTYCMTSTAVPNIRATTGTFNLTAKADGNSVVQESNENNNSLTVCIVNTKIVQLLRNQLPLVRICIQI
jgi:CARDB/Galactose oxidase, central domain